MKNLLIAVTIMVFPLASSAAADRISVGLEPHFYADNTEFFITPYATGETYLGSSVKAFFRVQHQDRIDFRIGAYLNFYYGDTKLPSQALPVISLNYHIGTNFSFIFGSLENGLRHGMPEALMSEILDYTRESELGFQLRLKFRYFRSDSWINWNLLNTPEHKEYFDFGNNICVPFRGFSLIFQSYISHHGGQLYHTGEFAQNTGLVCGLAYDRDFNSPVFNRAGCSARYLTEQPDKGFPYLGDGFLAEIYCNVFRFRIYADYWLGHNFTTEEGNPLYRTEKGWFYAGFRYDNSVVDATDFYAELRMHHYPFSENWEYQYRFGFRSEFSIPIKE